MSVNPDEVPMEPGEPEPLTEVPEPLVSEPIAVVAPARRTLYERLPEGLRAHLEILKADRLTLFATLVAAAMLTISRYHASTTEYHKLAPQPVTDKGGLFAYWASLAHLDRLSAFLAKTTGPIAEYAYWFVGSLLLFLVVPLLLAPLFRIRIRDLGTGFGDWRYGLKATGILYLVMLPFVVAVSFSPVFANHYPMSAGAAGSWPSLLTYELTYGSYFIGWEFLYRGMLCVALYPRLGASVILLHTIPFAVMHAGKPELEAYGSIAAGLALGVLAVRARSFWYGALLHAAVAFTMDALALAQTHRFPHLP